MERKASQGWPLVLGYLGIFLVFVGIATLLPLLIAAFYPEEIACYVDFLIPGGCAVAIGLALFFAFAFKREKGRLSGHQDALLLVLIWLSAVLIGAFPFLIASLRGMLGEGMNFSESLFEAISGYSTSGITVYPTNMFLGEEGAYCPHVFMFHRSLMQLLGGVGLVLIVAGAISDRYNLKLYSAEGHNDKLLPNLARSAKLIFGIYAGYIAAGSLALWLSGMEYFDAFCHSVSAVATGGFSTRAAGLAYFSSSAFTGNGIFPGNCLAIEIVTMVLMLLGATNFVLHTFLFRGKIREFFKDVEIRFAAFVLVFAIVITSVSVIYLYAPGATNSVDSEAVQTGTDFWTALRYSAFSMISMLSTTGYENIATIKQLGEVALFLGILLMLAGAGMGSTGGGVKQYRIALVLKDFWHGVVYRFASRRQLSPMPVYRLGQKKECQSGEIVEAHSFSVLYLLAVLAGTLILLLLPNIGFQDGLFQMASGLSGTGMVTIDFYEYKAMALSGSVPYYCYEILLWTMMAAMFLGRLEIMPIFYAIEQALVSPIREKRKRSAFAE